MSRRWTILVHRYLGIALSLLFLTWFVSGIAMVYAGGMPRLSAEERLKRMPPLDFSRVRLSPSEAVDRAYPNPGQLVLLTIMDRPAYRFGRGTTVFADTGETLDELGEAGSLRVAARFLGLPPTALHHAALLDEVDQWTISLRRSLPLHKIVADDAEHTELYVSEPFAEVVMRTTRAARSLAWVAAIPHWLYFAPLRRNGRLWADVVLWTSGLGTISVLLGLVLAVTQYRVKYSGLMRWHYLLGVVFGVFALTWVFSGFLSMQPGDWASNDNERLNIGETLSGGSLDVSQFSEIERMASAPIPAQHAIKELEFRRIQGDPSTWCMETAQPFWWTRVPLVLAPAAFLDSIVERVRQGSEGLPIVESQLLADYDAYYYDRDRRAPIPVLRVKFDDPKRTWVYIDPATSEQVAQFTRRGRLERWVYHGFHSLDFSFWYYNRPLWTFGVVALCAGGAVMSAVGVLVAFRWFRRTLIRSSRRSSTASSL